MADLNAKPMTPARHHMLQRLYGLYTDFAQGLGIACSQGCALCCTRNVTITSLEAEFLMHYLNTGDSNRSWPEWLERLGASSALSRFMPRVTINQLAELCIRDADIPEEQMDPGAGPCPFLQNDVCGVYPARPFGCRAMISTQACTEDRAALMPEFVLTVNNVFLQFIESADSGGVTGNLIDVLLYLGDVEQHDPTDVRRLAVYARRHLLTNRPMPVLMVPPEHRRRLTPILDGIHSLFKDQNQGAR